MIHNQYTYAELSVPGCYTFFGTVRALLGLTI